MLTNASLTFAASFASRGLCISLTKVHFLFAYMRYMPDTYFSSRRRKGFSSNAAPWTENDRRTRTFSNPSSTGKVRPDVVCLTCRLLLIHEDEN